MNLLTHCYHSCGLALLPPVKALPFDTPIAGSTFEDLVKKRFYTTSQIPRLSGIQLRTLSLRVEGSLCTHLAALHATGRQDSVDWKAFEELHLRWECLTRELYNQPWSLMEHYGVTDDTYGISF